jgi:hypothetical protein
MSEALTITVDDLRHHVRRFGRTWGLQCRVLKTCIEMNRRLRLQTALLLTYSGRGSAANNGPLLGGMNVHFHVLIQNRPVGLCNYLSNASVLQISM